MIPLGAVWALLGIPSLPEILVIAVVALIMYGRSGVLPGRHLRALQPWLSVARRGTGRPPNAAEADAKAKRSSKWGDRVFWFLAITAATAVAAWIVTRTMIVGSSGPPR